MLVCVCVEEEVVVVVCWFVFVLNKKLLLFVCWFVCVLKKKLLFVCWFLFVLKKLLLLVCDCVEEEVVVVGLCLC